MVWVDKKFTRAGLAPAVFAVLASMPVQATASSQPCPTTSEQSKKKSGLGGLLAAAKRAGGADLMGGSLGGLLGGSAKSAVAGAVAGAAIDAATGTQPCAPAPAVAVTGSAGVGPKSMRLESGAPFYPDYLVRFWQSHPAGTVLPEDDASRKAPGQSTDKARTFLAPRAAIAPKDAALIERKLALALEALLAQPSLRDIRGASLAAATNMTRTLYGSGKGLIEAGLHLRATPIHLDNPATKSVDGRYVTPGEGAAIYIEFNTPFVREGRDPDVIGTYAGLPIRRQGGGFATHVVKTSRPLTVDVAAPGETGKTVNPNLLDGATPPTVLQTLNVRIAINSVQAGALSTGKLSPTDPAARLIAAMFMTDWNAIASRMEALR